MMTDPDFQAPPAASPALPVTQSIAEAKDVVAFARPFINALGRAVERLEVEAREEEDERGWVVAAARRVGAAIAHVDVTLGQAGQLPEFESERRAKADARFVAWVDTVEGLLVGISSNASPNNPLIEVLFPHQKLEKVRRGGAQGRSYMAEVERRRQLSYVLRLAAEPEYAFLLPLLARFDEAKRELEQQEQPLELTEPELTALRHTVFFAVDALRPILTQARLLAEAALTAHPGWFAELGLDAKPKRRVTRSVVSTSEPG
jgi:hypothetical protein